MFERPAAGAVAAETRVMFAISDVERPTSAIVLAGAAAALRDAITGERLRVANGRISIPLHTRGVRMFVVE